MTNAFALGAALLALSTTCGLANDWSGFYAGGGIGNTEVDPGGAGAKEDDTSYGVHAGYRYDTGQWLFGGEFEYDWTDVEIAPGVSADSTMRLKASAGYQFGNALVYIAAGAAQVDVDGLGSEWGEFFGLGAGYAVTSQTVLSLEFLEHNFSDIDGSGVDADVWSVNLRASWRF
jgi:predicted porin